MSASPAVTSAFPEPGARKLSSYLPQLDGLRGIAILSVLIHHFGVHLPRWLDWGPIGVRIFFLLSGYLITLSVWKLGTPAAPGSGNYWGGLFNFHCRRFVRLTPVLYTMLIVGCVMGLAEYREALGWHAMFLSNFYVLHTGEWPGAASHLWSLSMQEQFYLLWPFVILAIPRKYLPYALTAFILGAFAFRYGCVMVDASVFYRWVMLPGAIDSFALGSLIACWKKAGRPFPLAEGRIGWTLGGLALACFVSARFLRYATFMAPWLTIIESLENVFLGWLLLRTIEGWKGWLGRIFENKVLIYFGKISYGLYVFHVLVHVALDPWLTRFGLSIQHDAVVRSLILTAISVGVATLSYRYVEMPLAAWARRRETRVSAEPAATA